MLPDRVRAQGRDLKPVAVRRFVVPEAIANLEDRLAECGVDGACLREADVDAMEFCLHPSRSGDIEAGVKEHLSSHLLRYNEEQGGVVLGYRGVAVRGTRVPILRGLSPHLCLRLSCRLLLFSPCSGALLRGRVNRVGADFVGLLVLGLFNVTVPEQHMQAFKFLPSKNVWRHRTEKKHRVELGSLLQVQVVSVQDMGPVLDVRASLDAPGTGCTQWLARESE